MESPKPCPLNGLEFEYGPLATLRVSERSFVAPCGALLLRNRSRDGLSRRFVKRG